MVQNESGPPSPEEGSQVPNSQIEVKVDRGASLHRIRIAGRDIVERYIYIFSSPEQVLAALSYATVIVALLGAIYWLSRQPSRMKGEFNIAVAEFREIGADGHKRRTHTSARVGQALFDFLDGEYKCTDFGLEVEVGHRNMPYVAGDREAEALARRTKANLVIYGTLDTRGDQVTLLPRFYVIREVEIHGGGAAEIGHDVDEIVGAHPFTIRLGFDPSGLDEDVERDLATRAAVLSSFTQGLVHLHNNHLGRARLAFTEALQRVERQKMFEGLQVLYLFAAVASRRLGEYEAALVYLDRALEIEEDYGRAHVALGNVFFSQALAGCQAEGLDSRADGYCESGHEDIARWYLMVDKAQKAYQHVAHGGQQSHGAYPVERGWLGLGNVYLWAAEDGEPSLYEEAINAYEQVVSSYTETQNTGKQDLVACAYLAIGIAYQHQGQVEAAMEAYRRCAEVAYYNREVKKECQGTFDDLEAQQTQP